MPKHQPISEEARVEECHSDNGVVCEANVTKHPCLSCYTQFQRYDCDVFIEDSQGNKHEITRCGCAHRWRNHVTIRTPHDQEEYNGSWGDTICLECGKTCFDEENR